MLFYFFLRNHLATPWNYSHDPLGGWDPQVENHCFKLWEGTDNDAIYGEFYSLSHVGVGRDHCPLKDTTL